MLSVPVLSVLVHELPNSQAEQGRNKIDMYGEINLYIGILLRIAGRTSVKSCPCALKIVQQGLRALLSTVR